jgi:hypothetical protein
MNQGKMLEPLTYPHPKNCLGYPGLSAETRNMYQIVYATIEAQGVVDT